MNILSVDFDPRNVAHRKSLAIQIQLALRDAGFTEVPRTYGRYAPKEKIFSKRVDIPTLEELLGEPCPGQMTVRVYSSILFNDDMRTAGKDSIKVAAVYVNTDGRTRGIGKDTRIHRTGTIERILERLNGRMANVTAKAEHPDHRCPDCGAPKFKSKKGNMVCPEFCWNKPEIQAKKRAEQAAQRKANANKPAAQPWLGAAPNGLPF